MVVEVLDRLLAGEEAAVGHDLVALGPLDGELQVGRPEVADPLRGEEEGVHAPDVAAGGAALEDEAGALRVHHGLHGQRDGRLGVGHEALAHAGELEREGRFGLRGFNQRAAAHVRYSQ